MDLSRGARHRAGLRVAEAKPHWPHREPGLRPSVRPDADSHRLLHQPVVVRPPLRVPQQLRSDARWLKGR
nr:unnamed protein product [Digitaria exilis]